MIFIIKSFRTIVFIFIVISTTFRPICPPAFFRCLSNSGTFTELRTTSFIETTGVTCSDSVSYNRVQVLSIPDNKLLSLDVLVTLTEPGFWSSVYRKPTFTGEYLNFNSHHLCTVNKGRVRCLQHRAKTISSDTDAYQEEMISLRHNNYPERITSSPRNLDRRMEDDTRKLTRVCLPYVKGLTERIQKICSPYDIRTVFTSGSTLRRYIFRVKPPTEFNMTKNCVYSIPCSCGKIFKGETDCPLKVRLEEHRKAVVRGEIEKSSMPDHIWKEKGNHLPLWDKVEIIDRAERWRIRRLKESAHLLGYNDRLSRPSIELNTISEPIIKMA